MNPAELWLYIYPKQTGGVRPSPRLTEGAKAFAAHLGLEPDLSLGEFSQGQKPCFPHAPQIQFSISHSGEYWVLGFSTEPIGVDVQQHRPCDAAAIAKRFFHPLEQAYLESTAYLDFFDLWTAKESYVKYTGEGITDRFAQFSVVRDCKIQGKDVILTHFPLAAGYSLCVCSSGPVNSKIFLRK
ncbi:4'-phosphopantetheinyl transferase family protein [Gehongia tenuis]|uniref:4'-phosphopantetheinyl transferase superfamily protein n=1 Tax=Gehongia tenuis TaxID=2763655 RepID=A0A926D5J4_9FIRM|nr:4'-phosphopantetheinyl transferase superfamily protein [Gehongia tenuis]